MKECVDVDIGGCCVADQPRLYILLTRQLRTNIEILFDAGFTLPEILRTGL